MKLPRIKRFQNGFIFKNKLLGKPLISNLSDSVLLPKIIALPVFASDALSSVAYAPNEIILTLAFCGDGMLWMSPIIGMAVVFVLFIIIFSYTQNVREYPSGGGDYEIVLTNIGESAGRIVGASLFIDYILTVAVSISSGTEYIVSMVPFLHGHEALIAILIVLLVGVINLRGIKESGSFFAVPVYCFIAVTILVIIGGFVSYFTGTLDVAQSSAYEIVPVSDVSTPILLILLVARAFASGTTALTGIEAISNGVPSFKQPKSKNAAKTLVMLGCISAFMLLSILFLSKITGLKYVEDPTVQLKISGKMATESYLQLPAIGQLTQTIFSGNGFVFLLVSLFTGVILFLAANTAFNGFPILCSILAKDRFLPQYMKIKGDRLAFSNGILMLMLFSGFIIFAFDASVSRLIQLYVVGVFVSFTLSQFSMILHWNKKLKAKNDKKSISKYKKCRIVNLIGFVLTLIVLSIILCTKLLNGAYLSVIAIAAIWYAMGRVKKYYKSVKEQISIKHFDENTLQGEHKYDSTLAVLLTNDITKLTINSIECVKQINADKIVLLHVDTDQNETKIIIKKCVNAKINIPLTIVSSPYRKIIEPVFFYVEKIKKSHPNTLIMFFVPEYVDSHIRNTVLHNQTALKLKVALRELDGIIISSIPYKLNDERK